MFKWIWTVRLNTLVTCLRLVITDLPTLAICQAGHTGTFPCFHVPVHSPTPLSTLSLLSCPFCHLHLSPLSISSLSSPCPIPQIQLGSLGERCKKLPQRVRAEPGRQTHFGAAEAKTGHWHIRWVDGLAK